MKLNATKCKIVCFEKKSYFIKVVLVNICELKVSSDLRVLIYEERLTYLNLATFKDRRIRGDTIELYKIIKDLSAIK